MLVFGALNTADFTRGDFVDKVDNNWFWYLLLLVLIVIGILGHLRQRAIMNQSIREYWYAEAATS